MNDSRREPGLRTSTGCIVVGVGASAGGLEAFQSFLRQMPADRRIALVYVQPLDPRHESVLPELLGQNAQMPVSVVRDGTPVEPGNVYVIPVNKSLTIQSGILRLGPRLSEAESGKPIDGFLASLALDQGDKAAGIILSGTGSDGAAGLRAIKEHDGMTMAQLPESAAYDGMPRNAIAAGLVDYVLPPDEMPIQLIDYASQLEALGDGETHGAAPASDDGVAEPICEILRRKAGQDFSSYKRSTLDLNNANVRLRNGIDAETGLEKQIQKQLIFERVIAEISANIITLTSDQIDDEIRIAQKRICECLELEISSLWQFTPNPARDFRMTSIYLPPDFPFEIPKNWDARESFPWCLEMVLNKEIVVLSRLEDAPPAAERDKETWRQLGVTSTLTFPLFAGDGPVFGALSFNTWRKDANWSENLINRLKLVSQICANALNRKLGDASLRESERRLQLAADSANAGLWSWDYATNIIWATKKTRSMYGYSPDEEITAETFLDTLHPDDRERIANVAEQAFQSGTVVLVEYRIVPPDKVVKWIAVRAKAMLKPFGEPDCMMGVSLDITQRKLEEAERMQLRNELAHVNRVLVMNEVSASLAHEINQPLSAILNNASAAKLLLSRGEGSPKDIGEILEDIIEDTKRAGKVVRNIRGMVKNSTAQFEPLNPNDLIKSAFELLQNHIKIHEVSLRMDLQPDLPRVFGERIRLQQVLLNLSTNALDAMHLNLPKLLMIRSSMPTSDAVMVCVSDSGPGIDEAMKETVFKPFYTTKENGLGMGLSICKSIIEEHGGQIWAENNPDAGATFCFTVKVWRGDSDETAPTNA